MKEKVKIIVLLILFILMLMGIKYLLDNQNTNHSISIENKQEVKEEGGKNMKVIAVNNQNFEKEVLKSDKPVLVDFYADWCGPCKMLSPVVEEIANKNDNIKVVKLNVDEAQDIAIEYGVMSIPTLVIIKNGVETNRSVGVMSEDEIMQLINN